jgi:hypothetical protein
MAANRENFPALVKTVLAGRVGYTCSICFTPTSGPQVGSTGALSIGVAAHITAASSGGPRFDASLTPEDRVSAGNGIWVCHNCSDRIDKDPSFYTVDELQQRKAEAEQRADRELGTASRSGGANISACVSGGAIRFDLGGFGELLEEKNVANGRFWAEVTFRLISTVDDIRLRSFRLNCYSKRAIPAMPIQSRLYALQGDTTTDVTFVEGATLREPLRFDAGETTMLLAVCYFRPYLTTQYPYEWDFGTLELAGTISPAGKRYQAQFSKYFRFDGARGLSAATRPDVPRLGDRELFRRRKQGLLTEDELQVLLALPSVTRYLLYCQDINPEGEGPRVATLLRDLPDRMKDEYMPRGDNNEVPQAWPTILVPGTQWVELPSAPRDPASVCMTIYGETETESISVRGRRVSWDLAVNDVTPAMFRYLE